MPPEQIIHQNVPLSAPGLLQHYLYFKSKKKKKQTNRKALVKLRISNHKLQIERGRYDHMTRSLDMTGCLWRQCFR